MESLRIALNLANTELDTGHGPDGSPTGPAPEIARRVAAAVDRTPVWVEYTLPSEIVAAAQSDEWDICFIAADPARAEVRLHRAVDPARGLLRRRRGRARCFRPSDRTDRVPRRRGLHPVARTPHAVGDAGSVRFLGRECHRRDRGSRRRRDRRAPVLRRPRLVLSDDTVTTVDQAIGVNLTVDDGLSSQVMSFIRAED